MRLSSWPERLAAVLSRVLAEDGSELPWNRGVVGGRHAAHYLAKRQLELLRMEGVLADGRRVDMRRYRWDAIEVLEAPACSTVGVRARI